MGLTHAVSCDTYKQQGAGVEEAGEAEEADRQSGGRRVTETGRDCKVTACMSQLVLVSPF